MLRPGGERDFSDAISAAYRQEFGIYPSIYACVPSPGAGELTNSETIPQAS
jgi:hypothetical protein